VGGDSQVFDSIAWHEYCICKNRAKLRLKIKHITSIIPKAPGISNKQFQYFSIQESIRHGSVGFVGLGTILATHPFF